MRLTGLLRGSFCLSGILLLPLLICHPATAGVSTSSSCTRQESPSESRSGPFSCNNSDCPPSAPLPASSLSKENSASPNTQQGSVQCTSSGNFMPEEASAVLTEPASSEVSGDSSARDFKEVFVSVLLNKLLSVDEQKYQFEAVFHLRLSWADPKAPGEIARRTSETYGAGRPGDCARRCSGLHAQQMCCDSLWTPTLHTINVVGPWDDDSNSVGLSFETGDVDRVVMRNRIHATFHSPFNFQRFPFDRQSLLMEFVIRECCFFFVASSTAMRSSYLAPEDYAGQIPTEVSGWKTRRISITTQPFNLDSEVVWNQEAHPNDLANLKRELMMEETANRHIHSSFTVHIGIERNSFYYVFMHLGPIFLTVILSWATFCVTPEYLELRIATSITLFLALTSERGVIFDSLPHSNYVTIMGYVIVWSYIHIVATVFQSLLVSYVYSMSTKAEEEKKMDAFQEATRKLTLVERELKQRDSKRSMPPLDETTRGQSGSSAIGWLGRSATGVSPMISGIPEGRASRPGQVGDEQKPALHGVPEDTLSLAEDHMSGRSGIRQTVMFPLSIPGRVFSSLTGRQLHFSKPAASPTVDDTSRVHDGTDSADDVAFSDSAKEALLKLEAVLSVERAKASSLSRGQGSEHPTIQVLDGKVPRLQAAEGTPTAGAESSGFQEGETLRAEGDAAGDENLVSSERPEQVEGAQESATQRSLSGSSILSLRKSSGRAGKRSWERVKGKRRKDVMTSASTRMELPKLDAISKDPTKAKIFISSLDAFCLVFLPLVYVAGLAYIYFSTG